MVEETFNKAVAIACDGVAVGDVMEATDQGLQLEPLGHFALANVSLGR